VGRELRKLSEENRPAPAIDKKIRSVIRERAMNPIRQAVTRRSEIMEVGSRRSGRLMRLLPIAFLAALAAGAGAQMPANDPGAHTPRQPYDIETFGMFRMLVLSGDFAAKVKLEAAMAKHPTTGVGAVADARGEIAVYDGKLIVSYGRQAPHLPAEAEGAALLTVGTVSAWQTVEVDHDVAPDDVESFLSQTAAARGLDPQGPFPFQIRGTLKSFVMHVNAERTNGPHGMGQPIAVTVETKGDAIEGAAAGFYVSPDLVGIVTHGGTRAHTHWVALDGNANAHLDRWGLKSGAVLSLPKP
jgi:hypothetical protein